MANIHYLPAHSIDFTNPSQRKYEEAIAIQATTSQPCPPPTDIEKETFYNELHQTKEKSALLSILPNYSQYYIPESTKLIL